MIHTGDKPATLYLGSTAVREAYLGTTRVYPNREPVITVEYSDWTTLSLRLSASGSQIPATGGSITISAVAHQARTRTTLSDGVPVATAQETRDTAVTPSLSSNHGAFAVSGTTVSCDHRHTAEGDRLSATITGSYGGAAASLTLYQQENKPVSYAYRVVAVSGGTTIGWGGGTTTVSAKSQRATTFTTDDTTDYEDTTAQTLSAHLSGSGFSLGAASISGALYSFPVTAGATSSTSQRTATVTFAGSTGGSASTTVRQEGMYQTTEFRYVYADQPSQYPRFIRNGPPSASVERSYYAAIKSTRGTTVAYHKGTISNVAAYDLSNYISTTSDSIGFNPNTGSEFMNNYPYKYGTVNFTVTGGNPSQSFSCMALFEKNYRDFEASGYPSWNLPIDPNNFEFQPWESLTLFSSAERTALRTLAKEGIVMLQENDEQGIDLAALSAKINAARRPDTDSYVRNDDGTWSIVEKPIAK